MTSGLAQQTRIFLSSTGQALDHHNQGSFVPGRQHYSYQIARRQFEVALRCLDLEIHDLPRPEIYAAPVSRHFLGPDCCHLIFRPAEQIRLLKRVRNIACVAWEFDRLKVPEDGRHHPFDNMRRMLMLPDEVWTPCEFTRRTFKAAGIPRVYRIPAPVAAPPDAPPIRFPDLPPDLDKIGWINLRIGFGRYRDLHRTLPSRPHRLSDIVADHYRGCQPEVFLSVLNPHDLRKNLTVLISGFLEFHGEHPAALLLLKLIVDNQNDRLDTVLSGILSQRITDYELIDSRAIWLTTDYLSAPVLNDLYSFASGYLCTSLAEGQNLPLQEAMARGVVPITTRHTAMLDYIHEDNAVIIPSARRQIDRPDTAMGPQRGASWHVCTSADVAQALRRFARLDEGERRKLAGQARTVITRDFSGAAVARLIAARLAASR